MQEKNAPHPRYLGIDFGTKRVGLALSDETAGFALPYSVLPNDSKLVGTIAEICAKENVKKIILGKSLNFSGEPNPVMKKIDAFRAELAKATNLPVDFELEGMTSREAAHIQGEGAKLDASAAALILKSFLDKLSNDNN